VRPAARPCWTSPCPTGSAAASPGASTWPGWTWPATGGASPGRSAAVRPARPGGTATLTRTSERSTGSPPGTPEALPYLTRAWARLAWARRSAVNGQAIAPALRAPGPAPSGLYAGVIAEAAALLGDLQPA
jgi:hypothetical protein